MLKFLKRLLCSHTYAWSERRAGHHCRDCGHFKADTSARRAAAALHSKGGPGR